MAKSPRSNTRLRKLPATTPQNGTLAHEPPKQGVNRACEKRRHDSLAHSAPCSSETPEKTLGTRFHNLPVELRAHIFALLLVEPVKWNKQHSPICPGRDALWVHSNVPPSPLGGGLMTCVRGVRPKTGAWRRQVRDGLDSVWVNPWRSKWAPPQLNPYVCTDCYDEYLRPGPLPRIQDLPCLCARRQNLEVLLVCKQWYAEAGNVFYTRNTFAFEDATTFAGFALNLPPIWRSAVSKISIIHTLDRPEPQLPFYGNIDNRVYDLDLIPRDTYRSSLRGTSLSTTAPRNASIFSLLRTFPSLAVLELDSRFLYDIRAVSRMRRLGLTNLRALRFSRVRFWAGLDSRASQHVWPRIVDRTVCRGGLAEEVARAIKGQPQRRLKRVGAVETAVGEWMDRESKEGGKANAPSA